MPSSHLILCHPLLLLPPIPPSIRVFSNESTLCMRWPKYWSFSFSISPSNEHPGLISFRMDCLGLLAVQGTLKSLLQHHSSKASIFRCLAFFTVQLSHPYMTTGKTIALTRRTFVSWLRLSQIYLSHTSHGTVMDFLFLFLSGRALTHHLANLPHFRSGETEAQRRALTVVTQRGRSQASSRPDHCLWLPASPDDPRDSLVGKAWGLSPALLQFQLTCFWPAHHPGHPHLVTSRKITTALQQPGPRPLELSPWAP